MNTLTIPELNLFNTRRTSPSKNRDLNFTKNTFLETNNYDYLNRHLRSSNRDDFGFNNTANRVLSSQSRYKQMAEDYLQKKSKLPSYFIQPTPYYIQPAPYIYNIPSYLYQASPQRLKKYQCQCESQIPHKQSSDRKLNRNPYVGLKDQSIPTREPKILKQPYLQATFRQKNYLPIQQKHQRKQQKYLRKQQRQISKQQSSRLFRNQLHQQSIYNSKSITNEVINSKIMQKLKTHQSNDQQDSKIGHINNLITQKHQASIQTQKLPTKSNVTKQQHRQNSQSKANVQKILQEQKFLIESLKIEFQKQNEFKIDVQDLQSTKNDYIDRSRQLLFKLNELADDKREFSFIFKAFNDKRRHNVFSSLQV